MRECRKALFCLRTDYVIKKRQMEIEASEILEGTYDKQMEYLNNLTHNLISKDGVILPSIGNFIAYKLHKEETEKELLNIAYEQMERYREIMKETKKLDAVCNKIDEVIDFFNDCTKEELNKYLSYKMGDQTYDKRRNDRCN